MSGERPRDPRPQGQPLAAQGLPGRRLSGLGERPAVEFTFAGRPVIAAAGDSIAMALWAAGELDLRSSSRDGTPRGVWCNMGVCYECVCLVDGVPLRACTTLVRAGARVERGGKP